MTPRMCNALRDAVTAYREAVDNEDLVGEAIEMLEFATAVIEEHDGSEPSSTLTPSEKELAHTIVSELLSLAVDL